MIKTLIINNDFDYHYINTVKEFDLSFKKYSKYLNITYITLTDLINDYNNEKYYIKNFDILIFEYTTDFNKLISLSLKIKTYISNFRYKIYIIQDEYHGQDIKSKLLKELKINLAFVNVNEQDAPKIFKNCNTIFINISTGYIPDINYERISIHKRKIDIFYRATPLHYIFGDLGQEKINIGKKMKSFGKKHRLKTDIEWEMDKKIFGEEWYLKLLSSKTTLATECGCKVFNIEPASSNRQIQIDNILKKNPNYTYEQAKKDFSIEPMFESCQVSPKMFEAVKLGTVLIMYEGEYKGIFKPNIHYIELKKDHSNMNDVLIKIKDDEYLQNMAEKSYKDIVEPGLYSYKNFIEYFDSVVKERFDFTSDLNTKLMK